MKEYNSRSLKGDTFFVQTLAGISIKNLALPPKENKAPPGRKREQPNPSDQAIPGSGVVGRS
jgi:hypothetical protein